MEKKTTENENLGFEKEIENTVGTKQNYSSADGVGKFKICKVKPLGEGQKTPSKGHRRAKVSITDKTPSGTLKTFSKTYHYQLNVINSMCVCSLVSPYQCWCTVSSMRRENIRHFYGILIHCNGTETAKKVCQLLPFYAFRRLKLFRKKLSFFKKKTGG